MLVERLDPDAADAYELAVEAVASTAPGGVDDLVLLEELLERADDDLRKVMGPHLKKVLVELAAERRAREAEGGGRRLPFGDHLLDVALSEAADLTGSVAKIAPIHLVLALFSFPGCQGAEVLERCGVEWRPLRSLTRRLTGRSYYDW